MMAIGLLAALQKFTRRVSEEPPDPNKERVETQQEEVSKVTKKEPQNKRKDDADNEVISQVGCTNLVAYNTEKARSKASLLPAPPQVSYNTQSPSAKREQVSPATPLDDVKHPPLNVFPTKDQNIPSNGSVGKVTEQSQSVNHGPLHSPPNSPNPTHQISSQLQQDHPLLWLPPSLFDDHLSSSSYPAHSWQSLPPHPPSLYQYRHYYLKYYD